MNSLVDIFPDREVHVILDNLNTHKTNERWLRKHLLAKVRFHFIPTRSSWLNQIETWFSILQGQSLNGASFTTVEHLRGTHSRLSSQHITQRPPAAIRMDQEEGSPAAVQKSPYHSTLISWGTSVVSLAATAGALRSVVFDPPTRKAGGGCLLDGRRTCWFQWAKTPRSPGHDVLRQAASCADRGGLRARSWRTAMREGISTAPRPPVVAARSLLLHAADRIFCSHRHRAWPVMALR